jgi:hypothetical protein
LTIFGKKPSEIRKAIVATAAAVGVLAAGILAVATGLPAGVLAVVASVIAISGAVGTYFTENEIVKVIDSADNLTLK